MAATKAQTLSRPTFGDRLIRFIFWRRRLSRLMFPSPAEVQFVRIMRGHALTISFVKSRHTRYPLTILWRGRILKRELIEREVRVGKYYVDFGADSQYYRKAIECDGEAYHKDVLREAERDHYLAERGWQVLHIKAALLFKHPHEARRKISQFLAN